jgi:hypothetical protein
MKITFDPSKRDLTLKHRGLDFARAAEVFVGQTATIFDDRFDYGERDAVHHVGPSRRTAGGDGLDAAGRSPSHHFNEALSCQRRKNLAPPHGRIRMMRRN